MRSKVLGVRQHRTPVGDTLQLGLHLVEVGATIIASLIPRTARA
ncbi:hypothetical protein ACIRP7_22690 [Streptomyces sp. NPDC102270]